MLFNFHHQGAAFVREVSSYLWHVQPWLPDGEFEDGPSPLDVSQDCLQLSKLDPGGAVFGAELEVFLVQLSTAVKLSQLQLQLDVALQQFVLRAFPDCRALRREILMRRKQTQTLMPFCLWSQ